MFRKVVFFVLVVFLSCSTGSNSPEEPEGISETELTPLQLEFLDEFEHVAFRLAVNSVGITFSRKWKSEVKIFLDGSIDQAYRSLVERSIDEFNLLITDGTSIQVVPELESANVHLFLGSSEAVKTIWPDINTEGKSGLAFHFAEEDGEITSGRIWVENDGGGLFKHELGHVLGFHHATDNTCGINDGMIRSFMCSGSPNNILSDFDRAIVQTWYHPKINSGQTFFSMRPIVEQLLLDGEISVEGQ